MATSPALLAEYACTICITCLGKGMAGENGGQKMQRSGKEAPKALDVSLGECTSRMRRALLLKYKTVELSGRAGLHTVPH